MRILTTLAIVLSLMTVAAAQATNDASRQAKVKEELQQLFADLNQAITKKDRAALERIYADEFQFIHGNGYVVPKTAQIDGIMANDSLSATPVPAPAFDTFLLYGDVAVFRNTAQGLAGTSIYVKKDGRWQVLQVQGTRLAPQRPSSTKAGADANTPVLVDGPSLLSANALYRDFRNNPIDASNKYEGKTVVLEGLRGDIVLHSDGVSAAVHIADSGRPNALILSFSNRNDLAGINRGQKFRFRCTVEKYEYSIVWMQDCTIDRE